MSASKQTNSQLKSSKKSKESGAPSSKAAKDSEAVKNSGASKADVTKGNQSKSGSRKSRVSKNSAAPKRSKNLGTEPDSLVQSVTKGKTLTWHGITVKVPDLKNKENGHRLVLNDVYGVAKSGEMVAIMGGSGAGKTTLMNQFVNVDQKDIEKTGEIRVNGEAVDYTQIRRISAYVQQIDVFVGSLTVREQLKYSARLRMNSKFGSQDRRDKVDKLIHDLNLVDCSNTVIGVSNQIKGISVGEKKRLAFACELLTDPQILFCDEPTSGLDSFMSEQVVSALRTFTKENHKTVVVTIHQPSDEVFKMFDKICFMAMGQVAFFGHPNDVCNFWQAIAPGYETLKKELSLGPSIEDLLEDEQELVCPEFHGPAEHSIRMLSNLSEDQDLNKTRVTYVRERFENSGVGKKIKSQAEEASKRMKKSDLIETNKSRRYAANWFVQVLVLFKRSFLTTLRDPLLLKVRLFQTLITGAVIGVVNWQTKITGPTVMNVEGIMYNCPRDMTFMILFPSIHVITSELPVMKREHRGGIYSVSAYYVAKSLAELPQYTILPILYSTLVYWMSGLTQLKKFAIFLSMNVLLSWTAISIAYCGACVFGNEDVALTYMPVIILPMLLFGGFYINFNAIPIYFKWLSYGSWFRYGFEGMEVNQWSDYGAIGDCNEANRSALADGTRAYYCPAANGTDLLYRRDINENNLGFDFAAIGLMLIITRILALIALELRMRFLK